MMQPAYPLRFLFLPGVMVMVLIIGSVGTIGICTVGNDDACGVGLAFGWPAVLLILAALGGGTLLLARRGRYVPYMAPDVFPHGSRLMVWWCAAPGECAP